MRVLRIILGIVLLVVFAGYCYLNFASSPTAAELSAPPVETAAPQEPAQEPEAPAETEPPVQEPVETAAEPTPEPAPEPAVDPESPAGRAAALGLPAPPEIDATSWEYILANDTHSIGEYAPPELETLEGQKFDSRIVQAMKDMAADTRAQGLSVYLSSGYRSYADQQYLYNRKKAQYPPEGKDSAGRWIVLPPGTSEHQTGLCCDITDRYYESKDRSLANTSMYQYMSQHCQDFGFIVRYPADKEEITMVMYEPWHFRYVGVEAATYIMENGLCLEEFLQLYGIQ